MGKELYSDPARYTPMTCAVCKVCFYDRERGRCVHGGPYSGYKPESDYEHPVTKP